MKCHLLWTMITTLQFPLFRFSYPLSSPSPGINTTLHVQHPDDNRSEERSQSIYGRAGIARQQQSRQYPSVPDWIPFLPWPNDTCAAPRRGLSALFEINMADICNFYTLGLSSASFASISMTKAAIRILELNIMRLSCCVPMGFPTPIFPVGNHSSFFGIVYATVIMVLYASQRECPGGWMGKHTIGPGEPETGAPRRPGMELIAFFL